MFQKTARIIFTAVLVCSLTGVSFPQSKRAKIIVLSALHQLHDKFDFYSFDALAKIIEKQKPDVLAVELTAADLQTRREQKTKLEYARSVFPLADKHKYALVPLEPGEPKFSQIVSMVRESERELREKSPQKAEAFSAYNNVLYEYLFKTWKSPADINSAQTDAFFEIKHNYQNELFGEKQTQGWERWNQHFLETILAAAEKHKGKKILVLAGVEHGYWLRKKLAAEDSVILLNTEKILADKKG